MELYLTADERNEIALDMSATFDQIASVECAANIIFQSPIFYDYVVRKFGEEEVKRVYYETVTECVSRYTNKKEVSLLRSLGILDDVIKSQVIENNNDNRFSKLISEEIQNRELQPCKKPKVIIKKPNP